MTGELPAQISRGDDSPALNLTPHEQEWLRQHPQIRVGLDPAWPPFSYYTRDGQIVGMDVDMLKILQQRLGVTFVPVSDTNWAKVYDKVLSRDVEMLAGVAETPERMAELDFTDSYIEFPVGIITRDDAPFMIGFAQMADKRIAAPRDYAPTLLLQRDYPNMQLILTDNTVQALRLVSRGDAYATLDNLASVNYIIKDQGFGNLKVAGIASYQFALRYGIRKDLPELAGILQKTLASISERDRETLKSKWIDLKVDELVASHRYENLLLTCLTIVGASILIVLLWNWTLAREVERRKKAEHELSLARNKAVDASRMKSAFLANLSHEIRNPLNAMLGFTELLKMESSDGKLKKYINGVDAGGRTLLGIINDVLDLSKVESGRLEVHEMPTDLRLIFRETHALFAHRAYQKGLKFTREVDIDVPAMLLLDELRLRQILYNLVTNAIKFTATGSVVVKARYDEGGKKEGENTLIIEVIDTGCGIPNEDQQRVFEPFAQRDGQNPLYGGTGLGLAISKGLTELMGGHVELESVVGKGSTFRLIFARVKEVPQESYQPIAAKGTLADFKPMNVLVIDDLEPNRELLKEYFQREGHLVWEAADAEQGIVCAQTIQPDVVLLDYRLPGMNGRDAAKLLKKDPRTAVIPIIFLSGSIQIAVEMAGEPSASVLAKPLVYAELVAMLRKLLPHAVR